MEPWVFLLGSATDTFQLDIQLSTLEFEGKDKILSNQKVVTSDNKKATIQQGKFIPYQTVSTFKSPDSIRRGGPRF